MFNKNLKSLSLFIILAVMLISFVSVASATDYATGGSSDAKIGTITNITAIEDVDTPGTAASTNNAAVLTVNTNGQSSKSYQGTYVVDNSPVTITSATPDGNLYNSTYNKINGVTVDNNAFTISTNVDGVSTATGTISITAGTDKLVNGEVYYVGIDVVGTGVSPIDADDSVTSTVSSTLYIPVTYANAYVITAEGNETVKFEEQPAYNGTVVAADSTVDLSSNIGINIVFDDENNQYYIHYGDITFTGTTGSATFKVADDADIYDAATGGNTISELPAGDYTVTFNLVDYANNADVKTLGTYETSLTVEAIETSISAELTNSTVPYDVPATITVTIEDDNEDSISGATVNVIAINNATGESYAIDALTDNGDGTYDGKLVSTNPLPVGVYVIKVTSTKDNYDIDDVTLSYVVNVVSTTMTAKPNPLYVTGEETADTEIALDVVSRGTNESITAADVVVNAVLRDNDGNAVDSITYNAGNLELSAANAKVVKDGYYIDVTLNMAPNYETSTLTIPIYVRKEATLTIVDANSDPITTLEYNYDANASETIVFVTLVDAKTNDVINGTVNIIDSDDEIVATITVVDGKGNYTFADLALSASDDAYTYTFESVADDVYGAASDDLTVTVYSSKLLIISANETAITYDVTSDATIQFNLTSINATSELVDFTGKIDYVTDNGDKGSFDVKNGVATIAVSELEGLQAGDVTYTFAVNGNISSSNTVDITITVKVLNGEILVENITATNNTPISIKGTVSNATDGIVTVSILDADENPVLQVSAPISEDGTFTLPIGTLTDGNYSAVISYTEGDIGAKVDPEEISIIISGESPEPTPTPTNTTYPTVLVIDDFSEVVDAGKSLVGRLTLEDDTPVVGMHIELTLTRVSNGASRTYSTTTDYNGEFQFPINLAVGEYTAKAVFNGVTIDRTNITYEASESPVTPFSVLADNKTEPTDANDTTVVIATEDFTGVYGNDITLDATFTVNDTAIVGLSGAIDITLTRVSSGASKTYSWFVTDYNGAIQMPIELGAGEYTAQIVFKTTDIPEAMQERFGLPATIYGAEKEVKFTITNP